MPEATNLHLTILFMHRIFLVHCKIQWTADVMHIL